MLFRSALQRFVNARPIAVPARVVLINQSSEQRGDEIFGEAADTQYTRTLCFSTATQLLS